MGFLWLVRRGFVQMQARLLPLDMHFISGGDHLCRTLVFYALKGVPMKGRLHHSFWWPLLETLALGDLVTFCSLLCKLLSRGKFRDYKKTIKTSAKLLACVPQGAKQQFWKHCKGECAVSKHGLSLTLLSALSYPGSP